MRTSNILQSLRIYTDSYYLEKRNVNLRAYKEKATEELKKLGVFESEEKIQKLRAEIYELDTKIRALNSLIDGLKRERTRVIQREFGSQFSLSYNAENFVNSLAESMASAEAKELKAKLATFLWEAGLIVTEARSYAGLHIMLNALIREYQISSNELKKYVDSFITLS